ncbi:MAG: glycosyltransferase family 2 protein [bacterium]|nr:glycosyltransferase family 2 protein [bacterium]
MSEPVLSVVVVNWNTREWLARCLDRVRAETRTPHEIIVVDNASTDGSHELVATQFPGVRLLANDRNVGFAAGCNQGLELARGRFWLLLNPDTEVLDGALDRLVAYLERHPEVAAVGPRLENLDGSLQPSAFGFYGTWRSLIENRLVQALVTWRSPHSPWLAFWDHSSERIVDWVMGACLLVRRSVALRVGLLDERFFMYGEEVDWQWRMAEAGHRVMYLPTARVRHRKGASTSQVARPMNDHERRSRRLLVDKHLGWAGRFIYRLKAAVAAAWWALWEAGAGLFRAWMHRSPREGALPPT